MWCTRWFLPLLLLPLPTATPYFLILFLVSLTLHARPCFYCIILLTALFTSSCYWQPVPTDVNIESIFPNLSRADALSYILDATTTDDNSSQQPSFPDTLVLPKLTLLNDRCWCELSGARLFEPFNTTRWQLNSFARTVGISHKQTKPADHEDVNNPESHETTPVIEDDKILSSTNRNWIAQFITTNVEPFFPTGIFEKWRQHGFTIFKPQSVTTNISNLTDDNPKQLTRDLQVSAIDLSSSPRVIRSVYDLRSYGIDLVLDFQWPRSTLDPRNMIITEGS